MGRSFVDFCRNNLYEVIAERVREHIEGCGGELQNLDLLLANVYDLPRLEIGFDIAMECSYSVYDRYGDEAELKEDWLLVQGRLDLGKKDYGIRITSIGEYAGMPQHDYLLNDRLIPNLNDLQCVDVANKLLQEFYPEHLQEPGRLDIDLLIERMGLQLVEGTIEQPGVKSQIFLLDGEFEGRHYKAGTILVDMKKSMKWGLASHRFNVVHECVHWFCHRKVALFESLVEEQDLPTEAEFVEFACYDGSFIETQTNKIAGMVLVPGHTLMSIAEDYLTGVFAPQEQEGYLTAIHDLLELVRYEYDVSKTCAKIRLRQCRVDLVDGFENYFDDQRVRDYVFNPEALPKDDIIYNFTISEENAILVAEENPKIKEYLESGVLLFVENHIVVNSPKFVEDGEEGYILTDYALTHMDECALRFYTRVEILPNEAGCGSLSRKNGGNSVAYCQLDEKLSVEDMLKEDIQKEIQDELKNMNFDYRHNLKVILKRRNITQEQLAEILNWSVSSVKRMFSKDYTVDRWDFYHICLALKLPKKISDKLLLSVNVVLNSETEEGFVLEHLLTYGIGLSYSRKLAILSKKIFCKKRCQNLTPLKIPI